MTGRELRYASRVGLKGYAPDIWGQLVAKGKATTAGNQAGIFVRGAGRGYVPEAFVNRLRTLQNLRQQWIQRALVKKSEEFMKAAREELKKRRKERTSNIVQALVSLALLPFAFSGGGGAQAALGSVGIEGLLRSVQPRMQEVQDIGLTLT